jgi:nitrogen-specific signal transduction histidine kinase/ActR/RegA family two-component response regulator
MQGAPLEAVCCWADVTERRAVKDAEIQLHEQLQQTQKLESIGRLAGGVAHDFNNLLTVINGYTMLLLKKTAPADPIREALGEIRLAGERATSLSRQLLTLSRKTVVQQEKVDLNAITFEIGRMLARVIGEDIRLETDLDPELGRIVADAGQMNQVLMNLSVNARDAMPKGGVLRLETRNLEMDAGEAARRTLPPGRYVRLRVSDTGAGIPKEVMPHLFEPFFTTKQSGQGTGLGLATVYSIVRQSAGAIEIQSEENAGTTVTIYFPWSGQEDHQRPAAAGSADAGGAGTILLVEDDEQVRRVAAQILCDAGYSVLQCARSDEAYEHAARRPGDIAMLLTDLVMPHRNGFDLARGIRKLRPQVPIVFMSGYTEISGLDQVRAELGAGYLGKPFTPGELRAKVSETMFGTSHGATILVVDEECGVRSVLRDARAGRFRNDATASQAIPSDQDRRHAGPLFRAQPPGGGDAWRQCFASKAHKARRIAANDRADHSGRTAK